MDQVGVVAARSVVAFFALLLMARLMGKQQISQLTYFDYIVGITIGDIAGFMSIELRESLPIGLTALVVWTALPIAMSYVSLKSTSARKLLEGEPSVVIKNGKVQEKALAKARYSIDDLMVQLRDRGVFNLADVAYAILEPNGALTVLRKSEKEAVTPQQLGLTVPAAGMPTVVIEDGQIRYGALQQAGYTAAWLLGELEKQGVRKVQDVVVAQVDASGKLYVDRRQDAQPPKPPQVGAQVQAALQQVAADLEQFALDTDDEVARSRYLQDAVRARRVLERLRPFLGA
ncbi:MAG: DUF421 domain-containing protein [Clostridia bacterium]|nr:DUF421 domain-containing protein [Clostridia bacterium]